MTRTEMNEATRLTLAELYGMQDAAGEIMKHKGVQRGKFGAMFLVSHSKVGRYLHELGKDEGSSGYEMAFSIGGDRVLIAEMLVEFFEKRPDIYNFVSAQMMWRRDKDYKPVKCNKKWR